MYGPGNSMFGYYPGNNSYAAVNKPHTHFDIMDEVAIKADTLNSGLPVGEKAYVIYIEPAQNVAFRYIVRVARTGDNWRVPERDLEEWDKYLDGTIEYAIRELRINEALDAHDAERFEELTRCNGAPRGW